MLTNVHWTLFSTLFEYNRQLVGYLENAQMMLISFLKWKISTAGFISFKIFSFFFSFLNIEAFVVCSTDLI